MLVLNAMTSLLYMVLTSAAYPQGEGNESSKQILFRVEQVRGLVKLPCRPEGQNLGAVVDGDLSLRGIMLQAEAEKDM